VTVSEQLRAEAASAAACRRAGLGSLMRETSGRPEVLVGLIDGPIATDHPDLLGARVRRLDSPLPLAGDVARAARRHGTFVAGMLCATRASEAPAICPQCTLVHAVIFGAARAGPFTPSADPRLLADGLVACVDAGAEIVNMSVAAAPSPNTDRDLRDALRYAVDRRVVIVAAAGNDGTLGSSTITRHPGVVPVGALGADGRPLASSNLGSSIGRRGVAAPGEAITSLDSDGGTVTWSGTSVAAPFVTGALALLRSLFPATSAMQALFVLRSSGAPQRRSIMPAVLDARAAYRLLKQTELRR
jgi:subtilisin family serine protease